MKKLQKLQKEDNLMAFSPPLTAPTIFPKVFE